MPRVMGRRLPPPTRVLAKTKSDHAQRKEKSDTVTIALRLTGRTIDQKTRKLPAPSILAAWKSSSGMPDMNAVKISTPNGTAKVESAMTRPTGEMRTPRERLLVLLFFALLFF